MKTTISVTDTALELLAKNEFKTCFSVLEFGFVKFRDKQLTPNTTGGELICAVLDLQINPKYLPLKRLYAFFTAIGWDPIAEARDIFIAKNLDSAMAIMELGLTGFQSFEFTPEMKGCAMASVVLCEPGIYNPKRNVIRKICSKLGFDLRREIRALLKKQSLDTKRAVMKLGPRGFKNTMFTDNSNGLDLFRYLLDFKSKNIGTIPLQKFCDEIRLPD